MLGPKPEKMNIRLALAIAATLISVGCSSDRSNQSHVIPIGWASEGEAATGHPGPSSSHGEVSLESGATPFGAYDAAIVDAVASRWYQILDSHHVQAPVAPITLKCLQFSDGQVGDTTIISGDAGNDLVEICRRAIVESSPWAPWPADLRRAASKDYRVLQFTFYFGPRKTDRGT